MIDKEFHKRFWNAPTNITALTAAIIAYKKAKSFSIAQCVNELKGSWHGGHVGLQDGILRRLAKGETQRPHNKWALSDLLLTLCNLVDPDVDQCMQDTAPEEHAALRSLRERFDARSAAEEKEPPPPVDANEKEEATDLVSPSPQNREEMAEQRSIFFGALAKLLGIQNKQLLDGCRSFFTDEEIALVDCQSGETRTKCYELYRPNKSPGWIVKSCIKMTLTGSDNGYSCYFNNYYYRKKVRAGEGSTDLGNFRVTRGLVIPTNRVVYMIGGLPRLAGLKIIALDEPAVAFRLFSGLLLSFEGSNQPIAARCVMRLSKATDPKNIPIGVFSDGDLASELDAELWDYLRAGPGAAPTFPYGDQSADAAKP